MRTALFAIIGNVEGTCNASKKDDRYDGRIYALFLDERRPFA